MTAHIFILLLLLTFVELCTPAKMPEFGALCTLITSTNLQSLANYQWSCANDDCTGNKNFVPSPTSGTCSSNVLVSLTITNANGNAGLEGTIPATFGLSSSPLSKIELNMNKLSGSIPTNLASIHVTLTYLDLSSNKLTGTVPSQLCTSGMNTLKFSANFFTCYQECLSSIPNKEFGAVGICGCKFDSCLLCYISFDIISLLSVL